MTDPSRERSVMELSDFTRHDLGDGAAVFTGRLPADLVWSDEQFEQAWSLHPATRPTIFLHGRHVAIPRWQQAFGMDYQFSGQVSRAAPTPELLQPLLAWARRVVHPELNGLLVNWYEGAGHYIGPHHDSVRNMVPDCPIVTVSFGEARTFRLSRGRDRHDVLAVSGGVIVIPLITNSVWKHSVPKSRRYVRRRISVTLRGFVSDPQ